MSKAASRKQCIRPVPRVRLVAFDLSPKIEHVRFLSTYQNSKEPFNFVAFDTLLVWTGFKSCDHSIKEDCQHNQSVICNARNVVHRLEFEARAVASAITSKLAFRICLLNNKLNCVNKRQSHVTKL